MRRCAADPELDLMRDAPAPREAEDDMVADSGGREPSIIVERRVGAGRRGNLGLVEAENGCDLLGPCNGGKDVVGDEMPLWLPPEAAEGCSEPGDHGAKAAIPDWLPPEVLRWR